MKNLVFRKASYSANRDNCVEVADLPGGGGALRDTKHRHLGHIEVPREAWQVFLASVKSEEL
ncbi:protein of unknown function [Marinactinospora thermotolerans DSM 45154]|uniref:DUF397 domain-containing protein n=1 Tax=Marinactinospora thermotolerans DSM 45154 TaxID=1122192 RepID=A0A1T4TEZ6_9ACTN|nr:DUF397 domain-containing protein [Marinactinospora thermotolerans]SKA39017.1 protein of unknown function [Marinactinospora thermotolerans DSM 45154]